MKVLTIGTTYQSSIHSKVSTNCFLEIEINLKENANFVLSNDNFRFANFRVPNRLGLFTMGK